MGEQMVDGVAALELCRRMQQVHISRIGEMPRIELYLDQVLSLVTRDLSFMALPGEELLTGSMVNNYVKQRVVPAPVRRRYTRRHVGGLIFVCVFKRVFSISEIKCLYEACVERGVNVASTYDVLVGALEGALAARFAVGEDGALGAGSLAAIPTTPCVALTDADGAEVAPDLSRLMSAGVEAVADKVFVEQSLTLYR